jgi:hypothetical protein
VTRRWNAVSLNDVLNEAMLRTGCLHSHHHDRRQLKPVRRRTGRAADARHLLSRRQLGVKAVAAAGGGHGHSEDGIRYVRRC